MALSKVATSSVFLHVLHKNFPTGASCFCNLKQPYLSNHKPIGLMFAGAGPWYATKAVA